MGENEFRKLIKEEITKEYGEALREDEIYIVWQCKILQNNKALASTTRTDGLYYEITYNGDKHETYIDVYKKERQIVIRERSESTTMSSNSTSAVSYGSSGYYNGYGSTGITI